MVSNAPALVKESSLSLCRAQVAALPVRGRGEALEVMLITSRQTRRWIIPKGWPMKGRKDAQAAAQEAFEEAGIRGKIDKHPVGAFTYQKRLDDDGMDGIRTMVRAMVYVLEVDTELPTWREKHQRERRWFSRDEAARIVSEPGLAAIIRRTNRK